MDSSYGYWGIWLIGLQGVLSYFFTGILKITIPEWNNGRILSNLFLSRARGKNQLLSNFLRQNRFFEIVLVYGIISFECLFPVAFILGGEFIFLFISLGFLFHVGVAFIMGYNDFLYTFPCAYPAIIYCSSAL